MEKTHWLEFEEVKDTGKTKIWAVYNAVNGSPLGEVKWHGAWRQYCWFSEGSTIWNPDCMNELTGFMRHQMELRKKPS